MTASGWEVHKAVYSRLANASPEVCAGGVYTIPPKEADITFPYLLINQAQMIMEDVSVADYGVSSFFDLHIFDRVSSGSRSERLVHVAIDRIHDLLHNGSLSVPAKESALTWVRSVRVFVEPDGVTIHGIATVEVLHRDVQDGFDLHGDQADAEPDNFFLLHGDQAQ